MKATITIAVIGGKRMRWGTLVGTSQRTAKKLVKTTVARVGVFLFGTPKMVFGFAFGSLQNQQKPVPPKGGATHLAFGRLASGFFLLHKLVHGLR